MVDLNNFTSMVQSSVITGLLVGQEYIGRTAKHKDIMTGEVREIKLGEYMDLIFLDTMTRMTKNPLIIMKLVTMETEMLATDRHYVHNCHALRGLIGQIIEEKKAQKNTSPTDFLNLLLQDDSYQDPEHVIDDMLVLFVAGSKTV